MGIAWRVALAIVQIALLSVLARSELEFVYRAF